MGSPPNMQGDVSETDLGGLELRFDRIDEVSFDLVPGLLARIGAELTRLSGIQAALAARLLRTRSTQSSSGATDSGGQTLSLKEVAQILKKSTSWVRRAVRRGELSFARRIGRTLVFPRHAVAEYLDRAVPWYGGPNPTALGAEASSARESLLSWRAPPGRKRGRYERRR